MERFSYLVQKHDATRLHYDLRLELDGVLLSWALTKGPSLSPAIKRLAVRTEDHPVSYGTFEGKIPKGQYGGGTVMLWDRGTWEPIGDPKAGLDKGHLAFSLHGERLRGGWNLVRMRGPEKRENWLLIKQQDAEARDQGAAEHFLDIENSSITTHRSMHEIAAGSLGQNSENNPKPSKALTELSREIAGVQLASLVDSPPEGQEWLHEIKFDGYRLLASLAAGEVQLRTRNKNNWTRKFPSLYAAIAKLKAKSAVLDLEAVVLDSKGKSNFQSLQHALGEGGDRQSIQAYVFDLLYLNGKNLTQLPLTRRKQLLKSLLEALPDLGPLHYSDHVIGHGKEILAKSCAMALEGIISKKSDSKYRPGRQSTWLKSKCIKRQEFVIVGYTAARAGARAIGALHLGYNEAGILKYAGKVGTGFTLRDAEKLYQELAKLHSDAPPLANVPRSRMSGANWVKPSLLCEVSFTEWTEDGHIRHPSFEGMREDKTASEVQKENPMVLVNNRKSVSSHGANLEVSGIVISHPDRVIFKETGFTKGDLARYYDAVAPWILKDIAGHPITLLRCPDGLAGKCFYQRNPGTGLGKDVKTFPWKHKGQSYEYIYIEDKRGLLEFVQMGSVELHPWGSRVDKIDFPDRIVFDLDPAEDVPFDGVKLAAEDLRRRLKVKGLETFLKCTGGKGLHITAPIARRYPWKVVKEFCAQQAAEMVHDVPAAYAATMTKSKRKGKIFLDYFRNDHTSTAIADYSVRARPGGPVALPLEWKELGGLEAPNQFSMSDVLKRLLKKKPDGKRYELLQRLPL